MDQTLDISVQAGLIAYVYRLNPSSAFMKLRFADEVSPGPLRSWDLTRRLEILLSLWKRPKDWQALSRTEAPFQSAAAAKLWAEMIEHAEPVEPVSTTNGLRAAIQRRNAKIDDTESPWSLESLQARTAVRIVGSRAAIRDPLTGFEPRIHGGRCWRLTLGCDQNKTEELEEVCRQTFATVERIAGELSMEEALPLVPQSAGLLAGLAFGVTCEHELVRLWQKAVALGVDISWLEMLHPLQRRTLAESLANHLRSIATDLHWSVDLELAHFAAGQPHTSSVSTFATRLDELFAAQWALGRLHDSLAPEFAFGQMAAAVALAGDDAQVGNLLTALPPGRAYFSAVGMLQGQRPRLLASLLAHPAWAPEAMFALADWKDALIVQGHGSMAMHEEWHEVAALSRRLALFHEQGPNYSAVTALAVHDETRAQADTGRPSFSRPIPSVSIRMEPWHDRLEDPEHTRRAVDALAEKDDWRRAAAAQAATCLLDSGIRPSKELVDWLFDALRRRDDPHARHAEASDAVEIAIATAMNVDPTLVERGIDRRWATASTHDRINLINCYSRYVRSQLDTPLSEKIPTAAAARALLCMLDNDVDSELLSEAAELLDLIFRYHADSANVDINMVLGALALICRAFDAAQEPSSPIIIPGREQKALSFLEKERQKSALTVANRSLVVAISALAARDAGFWSGLAAVWNNDPTPSPTLKVQLVEVLGEVAAESGELSQALPYLYSALFGNEQTMRAAAVAAFHRLLEEEETSNAFPEAVTLGLIRALSDQYLIVVAQACDVIGLLSIPQDQLIAVLNQLLHIAATYATKNEWRGMVRNALSSARGLARKSQYAVAVDAATLRIIASMRPYEAITTLSRMPSLSAHPKWTASVIRALRSDPQYDNLKDDDRRRLLKTIASQDPELVAPHVSELIEIAAHSVPHKPYRAWEIADVLSSLSFDEAAEKVARKALDAIPDTLSNRSYRLKTAALLACFRVEAACARGGKAALSQALQDWNEAQVAADRDAQENEDARRPFRPAYISD